MTSADRSVQIPGLISWSIPAKRYKSQGRALGGPNPFVKADLGWPGQELALKDVLLSCDMVLL